MKELTIEEKAKAHDEAISMAKKFYTPDSNNVNLKATLEMIFPELKESEDEKIKKELIQNLKERFGTNGTMGGILDMPRVLTWLEKQGEPFEINPTEFDTRLQYLIGKFDRLPKEELIGSLRFWMNVVQNDGTYREEKQGEHKPTKNIVETWKDMRLEVYQQASGNRHEPNYSDNTTKMFSLNDIDEIIEKMSEQKSDYRVELKFKVGNSMKTTNEEPLTITKIDDKSCLSGDLSICGFDDIAKWKLVEQKPADEVEPKFHEGDWVVVSTTKGDRVVQIASVEYSKDGHSNYFTTEGRWFGNGTRARLLTDKDVETITIPESKIVVNKIKSRSEEDDNEGINGEDYSIDGLWHAQRILEKTLGSVDGYQSDDGILEHKCAISAVKKLYEQNPWSEEDEKLLALSLNNLTELKDRFGEEYGRTGDCIEWLKSLKERYTWKPSDEQIKVCKEVYAGILSAKGFDLGTVNSELNRLEEQLKK